MRPAVRCNWRTAAIVLIAAALIVDLVAKHFAGLTLTRQHQPAAAISGTLGAISLASACLAGLAWLMSARRGEAGSAFPLVLLFAVFFLVWCIMV